MYSPIHLTIETDVEVTFAHLRSILNPKLFDLNLKICMSSIILSLGATLYLICFMVKIFLKGTLPYILQWEIMLNSLFHTLGPGLPKIF